MISTERAGTGHTLPAPILELRSVTKAFPSHRAVDQVSLAIQPGEFFALLGPSGCGKTTTLRIIAGFEQPDSGEVLLRNEPITSLPPYRRRVNTVFQSYALFPHLTARANVEFGLKQSGAANAAQKVADVLVLVQMQHKANQRPAQLSGGERQRIALARSLVLSPDVLLLDEPLSALDPNLRKEVRSELKSLQRRTGIAFLMVTHDRDEALSTSDRIALMNDGRIEQCGTPQDLYHRPATRFAANFLGAMNWLGETGIRPEAVCVSREACAHSHPATIEAVSFYGNCIHVEARLPQGKRIVSEQPANGHSYAPGQMVHLHWCPNDELNFPRE